MPKLLLENNGSGFKQKIQSKKKKVGEEGGRGGGEGGFFKTIS